MEIFEDYKRIAQQNGFLFASREDNRTFISPNDRMLNSKYCMLSKNDLVYFASDSYAAKVGMSSTYSGVYTAIPSHSIDFAAEISKHFWFDFISGKKTVRTNDSFVDKHLSISTNNLERLMQIVDVRLANSYLKLWDKYSPVKVVFGPDYLQSIVAFKGKLIFGIELNEWILPDKFESTFNDFQDFVMELNLRFNKLSRENC